MPLTKPSPRFSREKLDQAHHAAAAATTATTAGSSVSFMSGDMLMDRPQRENFRTFAGRSSGSRLRTRCGTRRAAAQQPDGRRRTQFDLRASALCTCHSRRELGEAGVGCAESPAWHRVLLNRCGRCTSKAALRRAFSLLWVFNAGDRPRMHLAGYGVQPSFPPTAQHAVQRDQVAGFQQPCAYQVLLRGVVGTLRVERVQVAVDAAPVTRIRQTVGLLRCRQQ